MKMPWSTVEKRWPQQGVVQFREPTCQHLSYASKPEHNPKNLMEAQKSLSSRAQKRWTHQGSVQFQELTHIYLKYLNYTASMGQWLSVSSTLNNRCVSRWFET